MITLPIFAVMAYRDIQTRRVSNQLLGLLAVVGAVSTLHQYGFPIALVIWAILLWPLAWLLYNYTGIGGADVKLLIVLPIVFPQSILLFLLGTIGGLLPFYRTEDIPVFVPYLCGAIVATTV